MLVVGVVVVVEDVVVVGGRVVVVVVVMVAVVVVVEDAVVEEVVEVVEEVLVVGGRVVEVVVNAVMVVVVDDVVGGAVVVVVVVVKLTEVVVAQVTVVVVVFEGLPLRSWQRSSQATVPGGSHSSPPSKSTIPSPHSESLALKDIFSFPRRARSVPVIVLQVGSILALRRTLPLRPSHEGQTALTLVPVLASVIFPEVLPQPLVREILIPSMTTASGSPSGVALMSGGPSTRKRLPRHAGAASATTRNEPRRPVARATASTIDAFIGHFPDGRGPSPSRSLDITALATSQARVFCSWARESTRLTACHGLRGHCRGHSDLTWAPHGRTPGHTSPPGCLPLPPSSLSMGSERNLLDSFTTLLGAKRFFAASPEDRREALLAESVQAQADVTGQLVLQVRRATELLVAALSRADRERDESLLAPGRQGRRRFCAEGLQLGSSRSRALTG